MSRRSPRKRIFCAVPCSPYFPSGIVRVEQYRQRLAMDGVDLTVINYFSPLQRRYRDLGRGRSRMSSAPARLLLRAGLQLIGVAHIWLSRLQMVFGALTHDAVLVQWFLPPVWLTRWLSGGKRRLIYDFDDALFLSDPVRAEAVVAHAWRVVAGSHLLYGYARALNPHTVLVPSSVPLESYDDVTPVAKRPEPKVPRIGWIGSEGTLSQLRQLGEPLSRLARAGHQFEFVVAGTQGSDHLLPEWSDVNVVRVPSYKAADLPALVDSLDIGVMPLIDGPWERGKCSMKALLYMAGGRPAVVSAVGENCHVIQHGSNGYLVSTADEWVDVLGRLLEDPMLRAHIGIRGRATVAERYATGVCYAQLWRDVFSQL